MLKSAPTQTASAVLEPFCKVSQEIELGSFGNK